MTRPAAQSNPCSRRGLTLIETLAALAILSLAAAMLLPLVRSSAAVGHATLPRSVPASEPTTIRLDDLLDNLLRDPGAFGLPASPHAWPSGPTELIVPEELREPHAHASNPEMRLQIVDDPHDNSHGVSAWLTLTRGGRTACRWLRLPDPPESKAERRTPAGDGR